MATSARQATNGFFNKILATVKRVDWFAGKFHPRAIDISFDKHITLHSLHSQPEAAEALNIMAVVFYGTSKINGFVHYARHVENGRNF